MADLKPAVQGDIGDSRTITLGGIDNLNAVTNVEAHVFTGSRAATVHVATLDGEVADASACTITVKLGGADGWLPSAEPGRYRIEYQLTFANGHVLTWPATEGDRLSVRAQGEAT